MAPLVPTLETVAPVNGERIAGSIVRLPHQDVHIAVLDPATGQFQRLAAANKSGTIVVRGENVFSGYLQAEHNHNIWVDIGDGQGRFYNTGDLGRQDENGYFYITGRQKEPIIRGGHNIDPRVIEDALQAHPAVALAAAIGRRHWPPRRGCGRAAGGLRHPHPRPCRDRSRAAGLRSGPHSGARRRAQTRLHRR